MDYRLKHAIIAVTAAFAIGVLAALIPVQRQQEGFDVTVNGEFAAPLTIQVSGKIPDEGTRTVAIAGEGRVLRDGQPVLVRASNFSYTKAGYLEPLNEATLKAGSVNQNELGDLYPLVNGEAEGSRIVAVYPDESRIRAEIIVLDLIPTVIGAEIAAAEGMPASIAVTVDRDGLPIVTGDGGEVSEQRTAVLVQGDGEQVAEGDALYVNYVLTDTTGGVFESTYTQPVVTHINLDDVFPGLARALVEQRVGSRIVTAIPSVDAQGTGDVVMVIDILADDSTNMSVQ